MTGLSLLKCSVRNTGFVLPKKWHEKESKRSGNIFLEEDKSFNPAMSTIYDITFLGHYTKDTIVSAEDSGRGRGRL